MIHNHKSWQVTQRRDWFFMNAQQVTYKRHSKENHNTQSNT